MVTKYIDVIPPSTGFYIHKKCAISRKAFGLVFVGGPKSRWNGYVAIGLNVSTLE